jgi:hypothetical protein
LRGTSFAAWFLMFLAIASLYMFAKNGQDFGKNTAGYISLRLF